MNPDSIDENPQRKFSPQDERMTAVSLFDQAGAANDFPVLKAFQEYIEAEQARSRKRMLGLSIFFVVLLVVVVITFSVIMAAVISRDQQNLTAITQRNQLLSDKLLDIALRERGMPAQPPVVTVQQPAPQPSQDAMLKPLIDKIENLASAISKKETAPAPQSAARPVESAESVRAREELIRQREALASIRAERAKIEAEQKAEREKIRQAQVEAHRRRLYPEYYAREDARKAAEEAARNPPPPPPAKPVAKPAAAVSSAPVAKPATAAQVVAPAKSAVQSAPAGKTNPVQKTQTLNVSSDEGGVVPFLIELP